MVNKIIFVTKMRVKSTSFIQQLIDTTLVYTRICINFIAQLKMQ